MARKKKIDINNSQEELIPQFKIETCKVVYVKDTMYAIDFKGFGISIQTNGSLIDKEKIGNYIEVQYESEIGLPDFKIHPKYL
jgi:hypothetical protein